MTRSKKKQVAEFCYIIEDLSIILIMQLPTHDDKQLSQGDQLSFEEFIDGSLGQASHLPPVREEGEAGPEEAGDVDQDDEDDDEIEVQELW